MQLISLPFTSLHDAVTATAGVTHDHVDCPTTSALETHDQQTGMQTEREDWVGAKESLDLSSRQRTRSHPAFVCVCVVPEFRQRGKGARQVPLTLMPLPLVPLDTDANLYATRHPALGPDRVLGTHSPVSLPVSPPMSIPRYAHRLSSLDRSNATLPAGIHQVQLENGGTRVDSSTACVSRARALNSKP
jgi:hypothetical protein